MDVRAIGSQWGDWNGLFIVGAFFVAALAGTALGYAIWALRGFVRREGRRLNED